jgi:hypothetical protein
MTLYHPRALANKLEELVPELQRWSHKAAIALDDAQVQQKRIEDRHLQTSYSAQMHEHQLVQDQESLRQIEELLQVCERNCQETLTKAQQTASVAQSLLNETRTTYNRMQQALQCAREALARAEHILERATADVASKTAELATANAHGVQDDQRAANYSLSAAKKAQSQANSAAQAASTHVARCTQAVTLANQALQIAEIAHKQAQASLKTSEDSIEFVRAASRALDVGKQELGKEETAVEATSAALQHAALLTQEASIQLVAARSHEQPAQLHTADTLRILQMKIDLLIVMNRAELELSSDPMVALLQLGAVAERGELTQTLNSRLRRLRAKLEEIYGLKPEQWRELNLEQRTEVLQNAHNAVAATYRFKPCPVEIVPLSPKRFGEFSEETGIIKINRRLVAGNNNIQSLQTLLHESRHAYQWHFLQPVRRGFGWLSEADWTLAQEWSDNFDDYKTAEQNSFQEYSNQPIEVDARSFAETVIKLLFGGSRK